MGGHQGAKDPARGASRRRQNELISAYVRTLDPDDEDLEWQGSRPTSGKVAFASPARATDGGGAASAATSGTSAAAASSADATASSGVSWSDGYGGGKAAAAMAIVPQFVEPMGGVGGRDLFGAGVGDLGAASMRAGGGGRWPRRVDESLRAQ